MNSPCNQDVITDSRCPCPQCLSVGTVDPILVSSSLISTRLVTIQLNWKWVRIRGCHTMTSAIQRAFTTLTSNSWMYLGDPQSILVLVDGHLLDQNQATNWRQRTTWSILLIGHAQDRSRSWSRDGNLVLYWRHGVGRRIGRRKYHLIGILQLVWNRGRTLAHQLW